MIYYFSKISKNKEDKNDEDQNENKIDIIKIKENILIKSIRFYQKISFVFYKKIILLENIIIIKFIII